MQPAKPKSLQLTRRHFMQAALATTAAGALSGKSLFAQPPIPWANDPRRPQFHLLPAANWMNDPNAPVYWKGNYHMFFQYNPHAAVWGDMHWDHAISRDMVHWKHLPVALAPTPGGPDAQGCFSGTALIDGDRVAIIYTGVVTAPESEATIRDGVNSFRETQCLAFASGPDLTHWTKAAQPIIAAPPPGINVSGFRDPSPWRQGDAWYMVIGSGVRGKGGQILLYRSKDLHHWDYLHPVAVGQAGKTDAVNPVDSGDMWECPDLFPLGGKHVLIYSAMGKAFWQSGELDMTEWIFHPQHQGILDYGSFYAPKTQLDAAGNRVLWGWIQESRPVEEYRASGWAGLMSLPRVLTLSDEGQLRIRVAPAVQKLSQAAQRLTITTNEDHNQQHLTQMSLEQCCGQVRCTAKDRTQPLALSLNGQGANSPWLTVRYNPSRPGEILLDDKPLPIHSSRTGALDITVYVDGSVIEVLVGDQAAYTKRFYYPDTTAPPIYVNADKTTGLASLTITQFTPISSNRLTT